MRRLDAVTGVGAPTRLVRRAMSDLAACVHAKPIVVRAGGEVASGAARPRCPARLR